LLKNTRSQTTGFNWEILKSSGCGQTPDTTHSDTEEGANGEELREGTDKTNPEFKQGDDNKVEYERPFSAVSVGENAEYNLSGAKSDIGHDTRGHGHLTAPTERSRRVKVIAVVWELLSSSDDLEG